MHISFNPLTFAYIKNENKMKTLKEIIEIEQAVKRYATVGTGIWPILISNYFAWQQTPLYIKAIALTQFACITSAIIYRICNH